MPSHFPATAFFFVFIAAAIPGAAEVPNWNFDLNKISDASLTFTAEQWKAIKPAEPARPAGGGFRFDVGSFLGPAFERELDADKDGRISHEEFVGGFARWMEKWDTKHAGFLDGDALRDGINKDLRPVPPSAPASPRGNGPGGPGFNLTAAAGMRNGLSGMMGLNFEYVHGNLTLDGRTFSDVGVRYKGNGTYLDARQSEKKSFKVDLDKYVKGQKLGSIARLNFQNNIADPSWMNEALSHELYREAGIPSMHTAYTRLFITVPGLFDHQYLGLYSICENPDGDWAETNFSTKKGLILKPNTRELFADKGSDWAAYEQAYDAKTDITEKQFRRVHEFAQLVTSANDEDFAARLPEFLDIDEFSRFMAVTVWLSSTDSILMIGQNFVVYLHPKTKKFSFVPWDVDRTFGNFFFPQPEKLSIRQAWTEDNRFLNRVMAVPAVHYAYLARLEEFQKTIFQPEILQRRIDEISALIRPAVAEEGAEKLQRFGIALTRPPASGENESTPAPPAAQPFGFGRPEPAKIRFFVDRRHASVAEQLAGRSEGLPLGGGSGPGGGPGGGRPPGGNQGFGPGMFLGPAMLRAAEAGEDRHVTPEKFSALAERWFKEWDADGDGNLTGEELRQGLGKAFAPPRPPGP